MKENCNEDPYAGLEFTTSGLTNKLNQERESLAILRVHGEDDEEAAA